MSAAHPICIGLSSTAMGSGKSTVAEHLVHKHGFVLVKMAGPLKAMIRELYRQIGEPESQIDRYIEGDLKETELVSIGATTRHLMQTLGTEWARHCISQDFWLNIAKTRIRRHLLDGVSVVVDDIRFINEMEMLKSLGAYVYRVARPDATVTSTHASEGELDSILMPEICNRQDIRRLRQKVDGILHGL